MQQTTKYKLNLVEKDDVFSPDPLNENMEKVEGALSAATAHTDAGDAAVTAAVTAAFQAADAALDQRVQVLELHKFVAGTYKGNGGTQFIDLGFTPSAVIIPYSANSSLTIAIAVLTWSHSVLVIQPGGFNALHKTNNSINAGGSTYRYIAFC